MEFPASNNRSPLEILVSTAFAGRQLNTGLRVPGSISKCLKHHPQNLFPSLSLPCRSTCALRCHFRDMAPESPMRCRSKICCCKGIIYDSPPPNVRNMILCIILFDRSPSGGSSHQSNHNQPIIPPYIRLGESFGIKSE